MPTGRLGHRLSGVTSSALSSAGQRAPGAGLRQDRVNGFYSMPCCCCSSTAPLLALCVCPTLTGMFTPQLCWAGLALRAGEHRATPRAPEYFGRWCKTNEKCRSFSGLQKLGCIERNVI